MGTALVLGADTDSGTNIIITRFNLRIGSLGFLATWRKHSWHLGRPLIAHTNTPSSNTRYGTSGKWREHGSLFFFFHLRKFERESHASPFRPVPIHISFALSLRLSALGSHSLDYPIELDGAPSTPLLNYIRTCEDADRTTWLPNWSGHTGQTRPYRSPEAEASLTLNPVRRPTRIEYLFPNAHSRSFIYRRIYVSHGRVPLAKTENKKSPGDSRLIARGKSFGNRIHELRRARKKKGREAYSNKTGKGEKKEGPGDRQSCSY